MDPYVLRLVSRGKTPQTSRLEHIPKLWLRAPVRVELACSGPEDSAAALAAVANYSLAIHSLDADRKPVDSPLLWYQVVSPAGNTGATKGPHAVFEIGTAEIANITEAGDYWIAVHAHTVDERIVRAAGYITLLDDGFPSTPPTPTPPGTVWLTQAAGDARYVNTTGDIMTGTLTLPAIGLRHAASGFDAVVIASVLTNDRELLLPDEDGTLATREWALANISGGPGGSTNISITADSTTVTVNSSTGSDGTISGATNAVAGVMTAAHVIALDGKVNKSGDTMTGLLTLPDIAVTNSATFGTTLAHNEISTIATAVRENQFPDAGGVFAVTGNLEGIPDKLGTPAKCNVAGGVTKGQVVYLHGADGTNPTFALANASSEATSSKTYGFIDRACALNGSGTVITNGTLEGLSIAAPNAPAGAAVWLSTVDGGIKVGTPPDKPAHSVYLGIATKVSNSGQANATVQAIEVNVQNGYELAELHDAASTPATANQALIWNSATSLWTPTTLTISLVSELQTALNGKAASVHSHVIGDVTGLQTALNGKAATSHTHTIENITGLQTALDGKAATSHTHTIGNITGLQDALDGKAATSHTHTIGNITGLQDALDGKAPSVNPVFTGTVTTGNQIVMDDPASPFSVYFSGSAPADDVNIAFPSVSGTVALVANSNRGMDAGTVAGTPSGVANGQMWYDSSSSKFKFRQGGTTAELGTGGPGGSSTVYSDTPPATDGSATRWFDTSRGVEYILYADGSSAQWVAVSNQSGSQGTPQIPTATTAVQGIARQATVAEALAGTVDTVVVSPATIAIMAVTTGIRFLNLHEATLSTATGGSSISYQNTNATSGGATITFPTTTGVFNRYVGGPSLLLGSGAVGGFDYSKTFMLSSRLQFNALLDPGHVLHLSSGIGYGGGEASGIWVDNRHGVGIRITDTNIIELVTQAGALATFVAVSSGVTVTAGTMYDILIVSRNGAVGLYLNGLLVASTNAGPTSTLGAGGVRISAELTAATAATKTFRCSGISIYNGI